MNHSTTSLFTEKNIPIKERLIFALDVPSTRRARQLVDELGDSVHFYKVGLELFMSADCLELVGWLQERGKKVFVDLKFFDVPRTVASAVRQLTQHGAAFATVHGNDAILKAAVAEKGNMKILAVTMLTSLDQADANDLGFPVDIRNLVLSRAKRALAIGCDGVISSGIEAPDLRKTLGTGFIVVTPGIRPLANVDDQKRTVDVEAAFANGADYIVVGRPIREHTGFDSPQAAANSIQQRIGKLFSRQTGTTTG